MRFDKLYHLSLEMKKISDATHSKIVSLLDDGLSSRQIASRVKEARRTVDRIRAANRPAIQKRKGGKKTRLTANDKKNIMRIYRSGELETSHQIARKLKEDTGRDFSHDTISCALREAGLKGGGKQKKPRLLPRHKKARRDWVYAHKKWSKADWEHIIWSDEMIIEYFGSHRWKWVWRRPGESLRDQDVEGKVKHGRGYIMIWGCMTVHGTGYACWVQGRMNTDLYISI